MLNFQYYCFSALNVKSVKSVNDRWRTRRLLGTIIIIACIIAILGAIIAPFIFY